MNLNEKFIITFFLILKISKSNRERESLLNFYEKFITKFYSVFKITKGNTEKQTGLFGIKNLLPNLFNFENDRDHHRQKKMA